MSGSPAQNNGTITNTQDKADDVSATKAWSNADGTTTAPDGATVEFTLYADGTATEYKVTLDGTADTKPTGTAGYESAAWKAEFINLPKYQTGTTTEIVYTVVETTGYPGYTMSGSPASSGGTITNTQDEANDVFAKKVWDDADNQDGIRPNSVKLILVADGTPTSYTVTLDGTPEETAPTVTGGYESAAWTAMFVHLPKYQTGTTTAIVYTVDEDEAGVITGTDGPGTYSYAVTGTADSDFTVTNTHTPETVEVEIEKEWADDVESLRPDSISITLSGTDGKSYSITLDGTEDTEPTGTDPAGYESGIWAATFVNLPKYYNGTLIKYSVKEAKVDNYEEADIIESETGYEFAIINTHETGDLTVKKTVKSNRDSDKNVKFKFYVTLTDTSISGVYGDMTFTDGVSEEFVLTHGQSATATGLPTTVGFTVTEVKASGFSTSYAGNDGTISKDEASTVIVTNTRRSTPPPPPPPPPPPGPPVPPQPGLIEIDDFETPLGLGGIIINVGECFE